MAQQPSSIHLLKTFIEAGMICGTTAALGIAWTDRLMGQGVKASAGHRQAA